MWFTERERVTLAVLGLLALLGLAVARWQQRAVPIEIQPGPTPQQAKWDDQLERARQLDLNSATVLELERLPGVGQALAERIVAHRNTRGKFSRAEELMDVPGVGPKTFDALQSYITVK